MAEKEYIHEKTFKSTYIYTNIKQNYHFSVNFIVSKLPSICVHLFSTLSSQCYLVFLANLPTLKEKEI